MASAPFPPHEALSRSVLVRNITHLATPNAIEQFFSFCGPIEEHRLRAVEPTSPSSQPTLEAVVIFVEEAARRTAIMMSESSIEDQPVIITPIPDNFDFSRPPSPNPSNQGILGGFAAFGDLFSGVGTAMASEMQKASRLIDDATETGVLKSAKSQMALASQKTRDFAVDLDDKWHVRNSLLNAAESGKAQATAVASAVATQTKTVARQVDDTLQISEKTGQLADRARENEAVNSGFRAFTGGLQNLMVQTGLSNPGPATTPVETNSNAPPAPPAQEAPPVPPSTGL